MTVETTARKQSFAGGQGSLTFTFKSLPNHPEYIKVTVNETATDIDTDLTYDVDYTVSLESDGVGGVITVSPSYSTAYTYTVYRETDKKQESDYADYNQFPADTVETDYDRGMLLLQELSEDLDRAIKYSITSTASTSTQDVLDAATEAMAAATAATVAATAATAAAALVPDPTGETAGYVIKVNATSDGWVFSSLSTSGVQTLQEVFDEGQTIHIADTDNQTIAISCSDTTNNPEVMTITNSAGDCALEIDQVGVLSDNASFYLHSNAAQDSYWLMWVHQQNASASVTPIYFSNLSPKTTLQVTHGGAIDSTSAIAQFTTANPQTVSGGTGVLIQHGSASTVLPCLKLNHSGTGKAAHINFQGDPTNTVPEDGDMWYDGSSLNFNDGSTTTDLLASGSAKSQVFTGSGTFTAPAGITRVNVCMIGGGGGGGAGDTNANTHGGGGGGGETAIVYGYSVTPASGYTVTIGSGGAGGASMGTNGATGGTTSFDTTIYAEGGGLGKDNNPGGSGGTGGLSVHAVAASGGTLGIYTAGGNGAAGAGVGGGGGGSSAATGGAGGDAGGDINGQNGTGPGAGGGGGGESGASFGTGGNGQDGYCYIWW